MLKQIVCAVGMALAAVAAPLPLRAPQIGIIRDASHNLRPVYGFSGNLITGDPLPIKHVLAGSFSDQAGIVLTPGAVKLVTTSGEERGSYPTEELKPVLGITGPATTAVAWLPSERKLVRWNGSAFRELPVSASEMPGLVVGLEMSDTGSIDFFIQSQANVIDNLRISLSGGVSRIGTYTGTGSQAVTAGRAVVFSTAEGVAIASGIRPVEPVALAESHLTLEKSSSNWIHLTSPETRREWMLHVDPSHPTFSELPAVQPLRIASEPAQ